MREIELKFAIDPASRAQLLGSALLAAATPTRRRMANMYFDSAGQELRRNQMALRMRRSGKRWLQTLKAGGSGAGGLHARDEWEFDRPGAELDLSLFAGTPLAGLDDAATLHQRLRPVFEVDFARTAWRLEPAPGCRLEVALDAGRVWSGERSEDICELEIECLEGDPACAFELAAQLVDAVALRPSATTKAERGYRLCDGAPRAPVKASATTLDRAMTPHAAARAVLLSGLQQLQANEEGVLTTRDPEFVHQARVALRRMRSALRMFRDVIGAGLATGLRDELGEAGAALGAARDWDVFATETLPAVVKAYGDTAIARSLRARAGRRRAACREEARAALRSARYAHVILDVARWLAQEPDDAPGAGGTEPLAGFAARLIRKRHERMLDAARRLPELAAAERHRVRIEAKRLRYGADGFAALFKAGPAERYLAAVARLQDVLGASNDSLTAARLMRELAPPDPFGAYAQGWFAAHAEGHPAAFEACAAALAAAPRFWKKPREPQQD
jgi:inorganic triphosphatase YgiF